MDIISHALYTNLVFQEIPSQTRNLVVFFSIFPDLVSFAGVAHKKLNRQLFKLGHQHTFPRFVHQLYKFTHSFVVLGCLAVLFWAVDFHLGILALLGWGFHILLDIFTHARHQFPTPILWPVSDFKVSGVKWSTKPFLFLNYAAIALMYIFFYF
jgi:membrane-bound metal-dependent hydrolase YbcI (DUF457 family)